MTQDHTSMNRRHLLAAAGCLGFALAVQPVAASVIHTDSQALETGIPDIDTANGIMPGYFAKPANAKSHPPLVIVIQEIFGVHEHIKDVCRRLAKQGYFAVAPELYFRHGDPALPADIDTLLREVVSKVSDREIQDDLDAAWRWAGAQGADQTRAAAVGFCWGGRQAWLYASHNHQLKAAAAWYGKLEGPTSDLMLRHPLDIVQQLDVPVLGLYGGQDQSIPLASVERMRAELKRTGSESEIIVYPDAGHGFNADYRPSYNERAAQDGWRKMLDWFARHGAR
ncbi:dienelactone hydrolase family protein [Chromobacterium alticapitis]|uniref:Carboxymethylenebutenolidase n=1 Tax=Chromobacterium alticapitis TaxID=2073169 RepID=A0A2S5DI48_9NEIS|nr:dienelactone hydrolase family protein [Chromobacterium alticapitis]POZ62697.1 carboxymethylenebutenolidase [Chromobacterium alticapitis]